MNRKQAFDIIMEFGEGIYDLSKSEIYDNGIFQLEDRIDRMRSGTYTVSEEESTLIEYQEIIAKHNKKSMKPVEVEN